MDRPASRKAHGAHPQMQLDHEMSGVETPVHQATAASADPTPSDDSVVVEALRQGGDDAPSTENPSMVRAVSLPVHRPIIRREEVERGIDNGFNFERNTQPKFTVHPQGSARGVVPSKGMPVETTVIPAQANSDKGIYQERSHIH